MIESIETADMHDERRPNSRLDDVRRVMLAKRVSVAVLVMILVSLLAGCAVAPETRAGGAASLTAPLDSQETSDAAAVVERYLEALSGNDIDALVETVTESRRSANLDNLAQLKRWTGFEVESIVQGGRFIKPSELVDQYEEIGFKRIAVFHVTGRLPQPQPDDVLPDDFDVIVVEDGSGRWLVHDSGH